MRVVSSNVSYVNDNGTLNRNDCNYDRGVRPFWWKLRASRYNTERRELPSKEYATFPEKTDKYKGIKRLLTDFKKVVDFGNLYKAYKTARKGNGYKVGALKFAAFALEGIHLLKEMLMKKTYSVAPYSQFKVYEPKERIIKAGAFKDKIVQHSLCDNVLLPKLSEIFIENNFAGQKGKGTLFGLGHLKSDMLNFYKEHGINGYILKCDITKYFYTIDHDVLKEIVYKHFQDENIRWLCDLFIDSTDGVGIPLGNQISQVFALLYLNEMDHFITEKLEIKYYGRYMDDFYLIHEDKKYLKYCLSEIQTIISDLKLSLNGKTQIIPFKNGIKFLGFHTYVTVDGKAIRKLSGENKREIKKRLLKYSKLVKSGKMTKEKFYESYNSWRNHVSHGNCIKLLYQMDEYVKGLFE